MERKAVKRSLTVSAGRTSLLLGLSLLCLPVGAAEGHGSLVGNEVEGMMISQQSGNVKGIVKDQTGEPLIGVSIIVKGTTNGTASDFDGNFVLNANKGDVLVFSFIGFKSQEILSLARKSLT